MTNQKTPAQDCLACGHPEADHKIVSDQCVEIDCRCEGFAQLDLDEMQRLADAATPGPWERQETMHADNHVTAGGGVLTGTHVCGPTYERHNALFIAAARDAVPALIRRVRELEAALSPSTSAHPADEHHDVDDENLPDAFEQIREEYDSYRYAVRVGVQRVRDVAARNQSAIAPEVLESLAYIGVPPTLVPEQLISERHDAEEREAESEDHAATATGDQEKLIAEALDAAEYRVTPDSYCGTETDEEAEAKAQGFNAAMEIVEPYMQRLAALAAPVEVDEAKLADVLAPDALEHWNYMARNRARYGRGACVCYLCQSIPLIETAISRGEER